MRQRKRILGKSKSEFPLSSMIDIVFLILIYFIVTQKPIIEETLIKTQLPGPPDKGIDPPIITRIDVFKEKGEFYRINGRPISDKKLIQFLKNTSERNPDQDIIINCGSNAKHEKLVNLLDACAEAELKNLSIINDETRPLK